MHGRSKFPVKEVSAINLFQLYLIKLNKDLELKGSKLRKISATETGLELALTADIEILRTPGRGTYCLTFPAF